MNALGVGSRRLSLSRTARAGELFWDVGDAREILGDVAKDYMKSCWYMEGGRMGILRRLSLKPRKEPTSPHDVEWR